MEYRVQSQTDGIEDLAIGLDGRAGEILRSDKHLCHGLSGEELSDALVTCNGNLDVCGIGQPIGVDERLVVHVCRGDADVATRKRCYESDGGGGVIVAVVGGIGDEIGLVPEVAGNVQVFDFRPVRGKTG